MSYLHKLIDQDYGTATTFGLIPLRTTMTKRDASWAIDCMLNG